MRPTSMATIALVLPVAVHAAKIRVPQDQPTIQAAVDAAQSGDQVLVSKGTYAEVVVVDGRQGITIKGKGKPVLGGGGGIPLSILNAIDVTVDGLTIDGSPDQGLLIAESTGVEVRRCTVRNATNGIRVEGGRGHVIEKNRVEDVGNDGIDFDDLDGTITPVVDSAVRKNRVERVGDDGIELKGSGHLAEKNHVVLAAEDGIGSDDGSANIVIQKNKVERSGETGISVDGSGHRVLKNKMTDSGDEGIQVRGDDHVIEKNKIDRTTDDGIDVENAAGNTLRRNKVKNAGDAGIEVGETDEPGETTDNLLEQNKVTGSANAGLLVSDGANTFRKNKVKKSGTFDLLDDSMTGTNVYERNKFGTEQIL